MKALIRHEIKQSMPMLLSAVIVGIFLCGGWFLYLGLQQADTDYRALAVGEYRLKAEIMQQSISTYLAENPQIDATTQDSINENLAQQLTALTHMVQARKSGDWENELRYAISQSQQELELANYGFTADVHGLGLNIQFNRYLLEHKIQPKTPTNACDGWNALCMYAEQFLFLITALCPLLLSVMLIISEREQGSNKLLLQQPFSRRQVLFSKFLTVFMLCVVITLAVSIITFSLCTLLFGAGDLRYPILRPNGELIPTWIVLQKSFVIVPFSLLFFSALGVLLCVCIKSRAVGIICACFIPASSIALQEIADSGLYLLPFVGANGYAAVMKSDFSLPLIGFCQILATGVCLYLAVQIFSRRDQT